MKKKIISNPTEILTIDSIENKCLIDIYREHKYIYDVLCDENNKFEVIIPNSVKKFFEIIESEKKFVKKKRKDYFKEWKLYKEMLEINALAVKEREKALSFVKNLMADTIDKECKWKEDIDTISEGIRKKRYVADYNGQKMSFSIVSYKNRDGIVKHKTELKGERNNEIIVYPNDYNRDLFNAMKMNLVKKSIGIQKTKNGVTSKEVEITCKDFIVRTNVLRCYNKNHQMEEIIGLIKIITPIGNEIIEKIHGSYCKECNCYFISISEYQRVAQKGVLVCQLIEMEDYYQYCKLNQFTGKNESVLMRNGYNVKEKEGLTDIQRHIVLSNLIDNNVLQQHEIVSYLNMFIAQKKGLPQYKDAVAKWSRDREYVLSYNDKKKRTVVVKSITKRK